MSKDVIVTKRFLNQKELKKRAEIECITILRWAKSCETQEQFNNVQKFMERHQWLSSQVAKADVDYWVGACHGGVVMLRKTKFNLDKSN